LSAGTGCQIDHQCLPFTVNMTLSADPAASVPTLPRLLPLRGGISQTVSRTMDFVAAGSFFNPLGRIADRAHVRVPVDPDDRLPLQFDFTCTGGGPAWTRYDFALSGPSTSDQIRIEGIRNIGPTTLMLTGPAGVDRVTTRGPVRIAPGDVAHEFDGSPARGLWLAFIPPDVRLALPPPICSPTETLNPLPDIRVSLQLACRPKP
jgi:hypothetical protein